MTGVGYTYKATGFEVNKVISGGGNDQITMQGSAEADTLNSTPSETSLSNGVFSLFARDSAKITVFGGGGVDGNASREVQGMIRFHFRQPR